MSEELHACADALTAGGATLMTARFHDHAQVLPLPSVLRRALTRRVDRLNAAWDDVHARYGGIRVDLGAWPESRDRRLWSVDRMHPSELGHRWLARVFAEELLAAGIDLEPPSTACSGGLPPDWRRDLRWILGEGAPWIGRRARDLGPWAARVAWREVRPANLARRGAARSVDA